MPLKQSIQPQIPGADRSIQKFASDVAKAMDARRCTVTIDTGFEVAGVRSITLQVVDRLDRSPLSGRWMIRLWVSETEWGEPGGGQTLGVTTGTLVLNSGDTILEAATDETGELVFTIELASAGTRYVYIANLEELQESGAMVGDGPVGATPYGWDFTYADNSSHAAMTWD